MTIKTKKIIKIALEILVPLLIAGVLVLIDQLTKLHISNNYELYAERTEIIDGFFGFKYVHNTGSAFSMFADKEWGQTFFKILTPIAFVAYLLLYIFVGRKYKFLPIGIIFTLAGTVGNYIDRLMYNYVIDFLSFTFFGWDFAIFNVADVFLCVGVGMILFHFLFLDKDAVFKFKKKDDVSKEQPTNE